MREAPIGHLYLVIAGFILTGCGLNILGPESGTLEGGATAATFRSYAVYESSGNWNDYVLNNGNSTFSGDGTACTDSDTNCVHGGEVLKFTLDDETSCANLTIADNRGFFNFHDCRLEGGTPTFYTSGLKENIGLADLISGVGENGEGFLSTM